MMILLLIASLFFSCEKNSLVFENDFEKSYQTWLTFKESSDNSYKYMVERSSWVGATWQTTITVTKGKITQRHYKTTYTGNSVGGIPQETLEWVENENEINSHKDSGAAEPVTLDVIYDKARNDWLIKRKNAKTYFEAHNNGLLSLCGYFEDNCADDCFVGIDIPFIEPLR